MLATVLSRAQFGMEAPQVTNDVHVGSGLPTLSLVGLPEGAVKESKDRVRSAAVTNGFHWPADLPKDGGRFDLPIAPALLAVSGQLAARALVPCEDTRC
jgi:magnesium chelatase family protein